MTVFRIAEEVGNATNIDCMEYEDPVVLYSVGWNKQQLSLIEVLNPDKIHDHWYEDFDYFSEYDTDSEEPGVYTARLTYHSWQSYEGDWDSDIEFHDITKIPLVLTGY